MTQPQRSWLENEDRFIPAEKQVAQLIDLLNDRGINIHYLLRKTAIFYEDILTGNLIINARQFARLCCNVSQLHRERDISFLFGQRMLPGIFEQHSHLLNHAADLKTVLLHLCEEYSVYFPLLKPRIELTESHCHLLFEDPFGESVRFSDLALQQAYFRLLIEMQITAIISYCNWRSGCRLAWKVNVNYAAPDWLEQYEVFWQAKVNFAQPYCSLSIALGELQQPFPISSATIYQLAQKHLDKRKMSSSSEPLLSMIRAMLRRDFTQFPTLEQVASILQISVATLKRKLKAHHCSYRQLCDEVRQQQAFFLRAEWGYNDETLAQTMNFFDVSNYRRALRRWLK